MTKNQEGALRKGALSFKLGFWVGQELRLLAPRVRLRGIRRLRVNLDVATDESSSIIYAGYAGLGGGLIECAADQVCKRRGRLRSNRDPDSNAVVVVGRKLPGARL